MRMGLGDVRSTHKLSSASRRRVKKILGQAQQIRAMELGELCHSELGATVQSGPFTGMVLGGGDQWRGYERLAGLLGTYEAELTPAIEHLKSINLDSVINIGAAEGYYSVGFARTLKTTQVLSVEIDTEAMAICRENAELNNVTDKMSFRTEAMTSDDWAKHLEKNPRSLVFVDCEGCEAYLFNRRIAEFAAENYLLIEAHEFAVPGITDKLYELFRGSHAVEVIVEGPRDPNKFEWLRPLASMDRWLAVSENRPQTMKWIWARPHSR